MQNRKFERAAAGRRFLAIFFALVFHLSLLAFVIFNEETGEYLNGLFAGEEKAEQSIP